MASDAATLQAKIDKLEVNMGRVDAWLNDTTGTAEIPIDVGTIPSLLKVIKQVLLTVPVKGYLTAAALLADLTPGDKTVGYALDTKLDYVKSGASGTGSWTAGSSSVIAQLVIDIANLQVATAPLISGILFRDGMGTAEREMSWAVTDEDNLFGLGLGVDGRTVSGSDPGLLGGDIIHPRSPDPHWLDAITDADNQIAFGLEDDGTIFIHKLRLGTPIAGAAGGGGLPDVLHVVLISQSNDGEGSEALPLASTGPLVPNCWMFSQGIRTWHTGAYATNPAGRPAASFDLVPLQEAQDGGVGETVATGLCAALREMIAGVYNNVDRAADPMIVVTAAVRGGRFLDELSPVDMRNPSATPQPDGDGWYYETMMDDIDRLIAQCTAAGKTYGVMFGYLAQGEAEGAKILYRGGPVLSDAAFDAGREAMVRAYWARFNADYKTKMAAHWHARVPLFCYQTIGLVSGHTFNLITRDDPDIRMVGPSYWLANGKNSNYTSGGTPRHGGNAHRTSDATRAQGVMVGKWAGRELLHGIRCEPVRMIQARKVSARRVIVDVGGGMVAARGLEIDTSWIAALGQSLGFELLNSAGALVSGCVASVYGWSQIALDFPADLLDVSYTVRYGAAQTCFSLPSNLVTDFRDGIAFPNGVASKEIQLAGDVTALFATILKEGVFLASNGLGDFLYIRSVTTSSGNTVLKGENTPGVDLIGAFVAGQTISVNRIVPYGNIRDRDDFVSPFGFDEASSRALRTGLYPSWNWLRGERDVGVFMS